MLILQSSQPPCRAGTLLYLVTYTPAKAWAPAWLLPVASLGSSLIMSEDGRARVTIVSVCASGKVCGYECDWHTVTLT